ncbi:MAG: YbaK/EbsC family protein [Candidatus Korobacteraceae bacterium]|jgi:Ala-tRNA(Pro) deacylase
MPIARLKQLLDQNSIRYVIQSHSTAYTAAATAAITHTPGKEIAKAVMVSIDGVLAMVVVPGSKHVDFRALKTALGANEVVLAHEHQFAHVFPDCEVGAMPPFGNLYNLPVFVDESLAEDAEIAFNAGSHRELLRLAYRDFANLVKPRLVKAVTESTAQRLARQTA